MGKKFKVDGPGVYVYTGNELIRIHKPEFEEITDEVIEIPIPPVIFTKKRRDRFMDKLQIAVGKACHYQYLKGEKEGIEDWFDRVENMIKGEEM